MSFEKLIICSGDSFTAGDELAGDLLVPGYTNNLYKNGEFPTKERDEICKKLRDETSKFWNDDNARFAYEEESKKRAWPTYLKNYLTDTEIINCAGPGLSNEEIVHRAISKFFNYKDRYKKENITVIIMTTTYDRFGFPMYDKKFSNEYDYQSFTSFHYTQKIKPDFLESDAYNFFFRIKDYDRLMRSISILSFAKLFFESNNIKIKFIDSCLWDYGLTRFDSDYKERVQLFKNVIPLTCKISDLDIPYVLAGYHFPEEVHKKFAEHISKLI